MAACTPPGPSSSSFRVRSVRIVVGLSAGGGYDLYARVFAPYLQRHLPGTPAVVVENMPGAAGLIATNYLAHQAPRDGSTMGLLAVQAAVAQLLNDPAARFDVRRFAVLGSPAEDVPACVMSRASGMTLARWRAGARPRIGMTNVGSLTHVNATLLARALGLHFRAVAGYRGSAEIRAAMEAGEVDGACFGFNWYESSFQPSADYSLVVRAEGAGIPELAGVPSAADLVVDAEGRELLRVLASLAALSRFFVAPPGTASEIVDVLRRGVEATLRDPTFREAAAAAHLPLKPIPASVVQERLGAVLSMPAERRARVSALLKEPTS